MSYEHLFKYTTSRFQDNANPNGFPALECYGLHHFAVEQHCFNVCSIQAHTWHVAHDSRPSKLRHRTSLGIVCHRVAAVQHSAAWHNCMPLSLVAGLASQALSALPAALCCLLHFQLCACSLQGGTCRRWHLRRFDKLPAWL